MIFFQCDIAPPPAPTPRPIPTLPPKVKAVTTAVTKSASTILIICVGITLFLFATLRIYDYARVIQLNMEISLVFAHITILFPNLSNGPESSYDDPIPMVSHRVNSEKKIIYLY